MNSQGPRRVVLLTGSELRHDFFRKAIALQEGISVLRTYAEGMEGTLRTTIDPVRPGSATQMRHLALRDLSERDFFGVFVALVPDQSNVSAIRRGNVNDANVAAEIQELQPEFVLAYGPSLVREPLLSLLAGRFVNVHLGLSPYYRGSGTNFWPLVNGEPEFVGATFLHIDSGIDTGAIIHQLRARIYPGDGPHQIGNRLIADMVSAAVHMIRHAGELGAGVKPPPCPTARFYRKRDFTPEAVETLYRNFAAGLVDRYEAEREMRVARAPLHEHQIFRGWTP